MTIGTKNSSAAKKNPESMMEIVYNIYSIQEKSPSSVTTRWTVEEKDKVGDRKSVMQEWFFVNDLKDEPENQSKC